MIYFFYLSEGMENCEMSGKKSGKSQGILRWMISGNPVTELSSRIVLVQCTFVM